MPSGAIESARTMQVAHAMPPYKTRDTQRILVALTDNQDGQE